MNGEIRGRRVLASVVAVLALAAGTAAGTSGPQGEEGLDPKHGLPFFDIKLGQQDIPTQAALAAVANWKKTPAYQAKLEDEAALRATVRDIRIDEHWALGSAQYVRSTASFLTGPSKAAPRDVVRGWFAAHQGLMELDLAELDSFPLTREFDTHDGLMHHFTWQQRINGLDLYGAELKASVTGRGELMNVGSTMIPTKGLSIPVPVLSDLDAVRAAVANVGIALTAEPTPGPASGAEEKRTWTASKDFGNQDPIESRRVYFARNRGEVVPAWYVVIPAPGPGNTYEMVVDAVSGETLYRWNRLHWDTTQSITMRVYPKDSPAPGSPGRALPDGGQFAHVSRSLITVTPAQMSPFSPNGWINDGDNRTVGNNVDAYTDAANDNTGSDADRATGTAAPGRVFDFTANVGFESGDAPSVYRDAAITQLFYNSNHYHDRLYAFGFNEAARNFQTTNFTGQGVGGDPVRAEAQDGSGTNNANFGTSGTDGSGARCQMYVWTGPTPDRDGDFDTEIIYHELSHGLSIRLHGGGLTGTQGGGMGEGWGDFFGACLNAEPADDFSAVYAMGGYATYLGAAGYTNNYHYGIRRFPYSIDFAKSPLTYADADVGQYNADGVARGPFGSATANAVHNLGDIWCNVLLGVRREVALSEGFAANDILMQLVVDGMKLAPSAPNMLQERDGILQADLTRYGGAHQAALWRGFARRGLGFSASSPTGGATAGIVEAFDTPQRVDITFPAGTPSQLDPGSATSFQVRFTPVDVTVTSGTQQLFYSVNGGGFTGVAMSPLGGEFYQATIPGLACFDNVRYYVQTGSSIGNQVSPSGAPASTFSATVLTGTNVFFSDDMEIDRGWVGGQPGDTATTGIWGRMDPEATAAQPGDDVSNPGTICWVTNGVAGASVGANDVDGGFTTLLSPALALAGQPDATISYWRWYSNNAGSAPNADTFRVEISANGSTNWVALETVGPVAESSGGWIFHAARVGDFVAPTNTTRVRFIADDSGTGSIVEAAIDEFRVVQPVCVPPQPCDPDFNQDGNVDQDDVNYLINVIGGGANPSGADPDFNQDGNVDQDDVSALIDVVAGGDCP
ncbi:MAG: M36 family metallopeptidase [Phycisphaerales bacterium]